MCPIPSTPNSMLSDVDHERHALHYCRWPMFLTMAFSKGRYWCHLPQLNFLEDHPLKEPRNMTHPSPAERNSLLSDHDKKDK